MADPDSEADLPEPARIRTLRRLVTLLTVVMIAGVLTITALLAWRLADRPAAPALPGSITLPEGERLTGFAAGPDNLILITEDAAGVQRVHLAAPDSGRIRATARFD